MRGVLCRSGLKSKHYFILLNFSPAERSVTAKNNSELIVLWLAFFRLGNNRTSRLLSSRSSTDSPRSLDGAKKSQIFSPLRPSRNIQSPSLDSGDEGSIRIERGTYGYMFQDIVSIKTMLLKLKRVLQEVLLLPSYHSVLFLFFCSFFFFVFLSKRPGRLLLWIIWTLSFFYHIIMGFVIAHEFYNIFRFIFCFCFLSSFPFWCLHARLTNASQERKAWRG